MENKRTPLLEELRITLEACIFWAEQDAEKTQDLASEALELVEEAIQQIQGAREDAARMQGRVTIDTELLDMLAPKEVAE
jgi:histone H3/H4